jgi:hypothetical protein
MRSLALLLVTVAVVGAAALPELDPGLLEQPPGAADAVAGLGTYFSNALAVLVAVQQFIADTGTVVAGEPLAARQVRQLCHGGQFAPRLSADVHRVDHPPYIGYCRPRGVISEPDSSPQTVQPSRG